jgi:hypothetical protein
MPALKTLALCLCLAAGGCAGTTPQDVMARIAHTIEAMRQGYLALCEDREETVECTHIRELTNHVIETYTSANDELKK